MPTQTLHSRSKATRPKTQLTLRALNRAVLARQHLLVRTPRPIASVVSDLAGMQSQAPSPPFVGLWSRRRGFTREDLVGAIERREVVRGTMMRGTLHLMERDDFLRFRPVLQPIFSKAALTVRGGAAKLLDGAKLVRAARRRFEKSPCSFAVMRGHLAAEFPGLDERVMGYLVRMELPLVQIPATGERWAYPSAADFAVAETWLGKPLAADASAKDLALGYLAAFGPASPRDFQAWSGLQGAKAIFDGMAHDLVELEDTDGNRLFDLPKAPRPDEDVTAPVRYLPGFDNLLLAYHDRRRIIADTHRPRVITKNLIVPPTFLVDGMVSGTWKSEVKKGKATLTLTPFVSIPKAAKTALVEEGGQLLTFLEPDAPQREVRVSS